MPFPLLTRFPGEDTYPGVGRRFIPPFVIRRHRIDGALFGDLQYGITVMRIDGAWVEAEFPSWEQESSADLLFRGGHVHEIDEDTAASLIAAGYTITEFDE